MAYVGLAKPIVSKLDENAGTPKYTEGAACGKAIGIDITPQYAEGSLYGDDVQCEYDKEFKYADITLNTTTIPVAMQTVMFGHTATEENVKFNSNDQNDYVGTGFYVSESIQRFGCIRLSFQNRQRVIRPKAITLSIRHHPLQEGQCR